MKHTGVTELTDDLDLPTSKRENAKGARHELDAVDAFVARIKQAGEPFFGVYYSYAPHYPYSDHGAEFRITPGRTKLERYQNNLRLLDVGIRRIVESLKTSGRLERTALLFVGDHGEAFGQHKGNWGHSRGSFEENLRVPAIFYQPRLFPIARISAPTSHVDLLPTLLDALGKSFEAESMQGGSLFSSPLGEARYAYGSEDVLSSIGRDGVKIQISFRLDRCWAFDLTRDPLEKQRLSCDRFPARVDAMLQFRKFQRDFLPSYNAELRKTKSQ
jgi:arylsulfatase A-like enzyme